MCLLLRSGHSTSQYSNVWRRWPADSTAQAVLANWVAKVLAGHGDAATDEVERSALVAEISAESSASNSTDNDRTQQRCAVCRRLCWVKQARSSLDAAGQLMPSILTA